MKEESTSEQSTVILLGPILRTRTSQVYKGRCTIRTIWRVFGENFKRFKDLRIGIDESKIFKYFSSKHCEYIRESYLSESITQMIRGWWLLLIYYFF